MRLSKEIIDELIKTRKIYNNNCGLDRFPGQLLFLDSDQINYENKIIDINLYAWYDKKSEKAKSFIISYRWNYIILDFHYEAVAVYENLVNKYEIQE